MPIRVFISHSHEHHMLSDAVAALLKDTLALCDDDILNTSQSSTALPAGSIVVEQLSQGHLQVERKCAHRVWTGNSNACGLNCETRRKPFRGRC